MTILHVKDHRYLIIGGTTKAATTSLFFYLADHPQVCAANMKETGFFLNAEYPYPLPLKYRFEDGLEKYEVFFRHCSDARLRVEATPDYLYSPGTPQKVKESLPQVKLMFILREPVSRLVSWYRFAKQTGALPKTFSFEAYVQEQLTAIEGGSLNAPQHMRALEQGRYSLYLKPYFQLFGRERVCVILYEDFIRNPRQVMLEISFFARVNPTFFDTFEFKVFNETQVMKNPSVHRTYLEISQRLRKYVNYRPQIRKVLRSIRLAIEPFYLKMNTCPSEEVTISPGIKMLLDDYYRDEADALVALLKRPVSWQF